MSEDTLMRLLGFLTGCGVMGAALSLYQMWKLR